MKKVNHWINGKNVAGNDYFQTTNPATGEVLADVASGGEAEINQAVAAAKEAFPKWANLPMKERARLMRRLGDLIDQNVPEIAAMETADTGLPIHQTKNVLIPRASHNFEFFAEVCQQMNGKTYPVDDKMLNYTLVQPVGVCALVSPWNVPFMTATWKVAPCLALGNTAVLKMSELSPLTADRLGELALEAGIPAGVLNVVQGYGATAGDALVRHHDVRAPPGAPRRRRRSRRFWVQALWDRSWRAIGNGGCPYKDSASESCSPRAFSIGNAKYRRPCGRYNVRPTKMRLFTPESLCCAVNFRTALMPEGKNGRPTKK